MKVRVEVDVDVEATPQELRSFFGLPDLEVLQKEAIELIRQNMTEGKEGFDPLTLMKPFFSEQLRELSEQLQALSNVQKGKSASATKSKTGK